MRVLIITGTMGAGKSTLMAEASDLLKAEKIVHAAIDLDALDIGYFGELGRDNGIGWRNLRALRQNYAASGVRNLLIAAAVEGHAELDRLLEAAGASSVVLCRLRASPAMMQERVRVREPGMLQQTFVDRVLTLDAILDAAGLEDFSLMNDGSDVTGVAREMLARAGWLPSL
jgi:hypothetical protein